MSAAAKPVWISQLDNPQEAVEELASVARCEGGGDDTTCIAFYISQAVDGLSADHSADQNAEQSTGWSRLTSVFRGAL